MRSIHKEGAPARVKRERLASGFDYPTQLVGTTKWTGQDGGPVTVYYDPSLGAGGLAIAQNVLGRLDALMAYCDAIFGIKGKSGNVIVAPLSTAGDGSGGAYHGSCQFNADSPAGSNWYEDYAANNPDLVFGLVMAEVCESYMGTVASKNFNCGGSGGEGLSRFLAEVVTGGATGAMSGFSAGPSWDGTDWISRDQGTDQDYPSIGCSILYIWWMTKLGYTVQQIVQAGEPDGTLATNYAALTNKPATQAFTDFKAAVAAVGGPGGFQTDNPFGAANPPYPLGTPTPTPTPTPVPAPTPAPSTVTINIPQTNIVFKQGPFGHISEAYLPALSVTANVNAPGTETISLDAATVSALRATGGTINTGHEVIDAAFRQLYKSLAAHDAANGVATGPVSFSIPTWLPNLLKIACAIAAGFAGSIPPPWGQIITTVCAIVNPPAPAPAHLSKPCGCP